MHSYSDVRSVILGERQWACVCSEVQHFLRQLPAQCVHQVITSPPYWGLRSYDTAEWVGGRTGCEHEGVASCECGAVKIDLQIGLEETPRQYVDRMVDVFADVWRVLRDDGTVWLNIGDKQFTNKDKMKIPGLKPKDMIGLPWMLAFALREFGWFLRDEIIWDKPSPMACSSKDKFTRAHEQIFLLAKQRHYFFDRIAVLEPAKSAGRKLSRSSGWGKGETHDPKIIQGRGGYEQTGLIQPRFRLKRTVWRIPSQSYRGAHFATFPPRLVEPCILAGTSGRGVCQECGNPMIRQVKTTRVPTRPGTDTKVSRDRRTGKPVPLVDRPWAAAEVGNRDPKRHVSLYETTGWLPSCSCSAPIAGAIVLDVFTGSGTTAMKAVELGRRFIGCDLSKTYMDQVERRVQSVTPKIVEHRDA